jgi:hypothetical protein
MIGLVKSRQVKKIMENGSYEFTSVKNGFNNDDVFTIDASVLKESKKVLDLSLTDKGKNREYQVGMNHGEDGKGYIIAGEGIVDGQPKRADKSSPTEEHSGSEVNIHSHPTGAEMVDGVGWSSSADEPSSRDQENMSIYKMSIIVGKNGLVPTINDKSIDGSISTFLGKDNRPPSINIFDNDHKDKGHPTATITGKDADKILSDYEKR